MDAAPEIMNEAFCAYVMTVPNEDRLSAFLRNNGLTSEAISAEMKAVIKTAENFLYGYPGGVPWTEAFAGEFREVLARAHPWLNAESHRQLRAFAQWLCWHEGLDAPAASIAPAVAVAPLPGRPRVSAEEAIASTAREALVDSDPVPAPPSTPGRRRFPWLPYAILLFLIISFALAPIASVVLSSFIANANGCESTKDQSIRA